MACIRRTYGYIILLLFATLLAPALATDFGACKTKVQSVLNGKSVNFSSFDIIYRGKIRGLKEDGGAAPLTLTLEGCREACGTGSAPNDVLKAFQILTTWVLPAVALLSQLPYESLSDDKRKNIEAFCNWVGSPASALTTTIFNIHMIRKARKLSARGTEAQKNAYYVLTCINQYRWPRGGTSCVQRDKALLYGLLRPISKDTTALPRDSEAIAKTRSLLANLAFQLRLQRRKAVWPLAINVLWFLLAFIFSIVVAFANLGDNSTAHSLALGLLLSWLPVLVVMAIVDRNPIGAVRCKILIQRWLYQVNTILHGPDGLNDEPNRLLWQRGDEVPYDIGEFVGQGRRLRYCGVAHAVFYLKAQNETTARQAPQDLGGGDDFKKALLKRPGAWWTIWFLSLGIVTTSFGMAFLVSFKTPTIGLGCRSLVYLIYYLLGMVSWFSQIFSQDMPNWARFITLGFNALAAALLLLIMGIQVTNGFNNCLCKSSTFGTRSYGGYIDFENAQFYRKQYEVQTVWIVATAIGFVVSFCGVGWAVRKWNRSAELWRVDEAGDPEHDGLELDSTWMT